MQYLCAPRVRRPLRMYRISRFATLLLVIGLGAIGAAHAAKKTVCTITVNSADERETFRRNLPASEFDFVELVERGRPDWLAAACRKGVTCDALLISGHFDGGTEFYSDRVDAREYLPVDEMERVSCSNSCPGLFSQLKEVYLFGCNTLNAEAMKFATGEIVRSLMRSGYSQSDADQLSRVLSERHGESNRDRMRYIFKDVPVIYGFSSKAPLGPSAATVLERYFQGGGGSDVATGRANPKLIGLFAASSMTLADGVSDGDPQAPHRRDVCQFADERLTTAQKVGFVHSMLARQTVEARMFLDRLETQSASLTPAARQAPDVAAALDAIAGDEAAKSRYLDLARDADQLSTSVRMLEVARALGWLSTAETHDEMIGMIGQRVTRNDVGVGEVELVCRLNKGHDLDATATTLGAVSKYKDNVGTAAALACLGRPDARSRVLRALSSRSDEDVQIAQVYFAHRPIEDVSELRDVTVSIAKMDSPLAQVRALESLAALRVSDPQSLDALTRLFPRTKSVDVQRAIAGVLIRADYQAMAKPEVARALRQHRLKSPDGEDLIDVLIRRLQIAS